MNIVTKLLSAFRRAEPIDVCEPSVTTENYLERLELEQRLEILEARVSVTTLLPRREHGTW